MVRIIQYVVILVGIIAVVVFGFIYSRDHYCWTRVPESDDIYIYTAEMEFGQQNHRVADSRGIEIDPAYFGDYARPEDVPAIAAIDGVTGVYLFDDSFFLAEGGLMDRMAAGDETAEASMPMAVYEDYAEICGLGTLFTVTEGEAPADGAGEIVLPTSWLQDVYGIEDPASAIGKGLEFEGETYILTGIHTYGFAWVSFNPGDDLGFYTYDEETFPAYMEKAQSFWDGLDEPWLLSGLVACEDETAEQSVQDQLLSNWPGSNYQSKPFIQDFAASYNRSFWIAMAIAVGVVALIVVVTCVLLQRWLRKRVRVVQQQPDEEELKLTGQVTDPEDPGGPEGPGGPEDPEGPEREEGPEEKKDPEDPE